MYESSISVERIKELVWFHCFTSRLNEDVLVIHGLKIMNLSEKDEIEDFEKDFLIINLTKTYVMSIEVKSSLTKNSVKSEVVDEMIEDAM